MSGWKPSFRYRMSSDIDIRVHSYIRYQKRYKFLPAEYDIDIRVHSYIRYQKRYKFLPAEYESKILVFSGECITLQLLCWSVNNGMSDIGYWIKAHSDFRYNVGLCSLQSDIGSSDIQLSPISLITEIGLSAHLCPPLHIIYTQMSINWVKRPLVNKQNLLFNYCFICKKLKLLKEY